MKQSDLFTDFHKSVRIVYRYFRKTRGKEWTQDECLKLFKIVFPEKYRVETCEEKLICMSDEAVERMAHLFDTWKPDGVLKLLCEFALKESTNMMDRGCFIRFCGDIMPVVMRIRKLVPRECGRLMGCDEKTIDIIESCGVSNSAMYKLYGNSIVVDVLYHIFRKLFVETEPDMIKGQAYQQSLF